MAGPPGPLEVQKADPLSPPVVRKVGLLHPPAVRKAAHHETEAGREEGEGVPGDAPRRPATARLTPRQAARATAGRTANRAVRQAPRQAARFPATLRAAPSPVAADPPEAAGRSRDPGAAGLAGGVGLVGTRVAASGMEAPATARSVARRAVPPRRKTKPPVRRASFGTSAATPRVGRELPRVGTIVEEGARARGGNGAGRDPTVREDLPARAWCASRRARQSCPAWPRFSSG